MEIYRVHYTNLTILLVANRSFIKMTTNKTKIQLAEASSQYLEELEERRNECCCGIHVQVGSKNI
jgi:hypothetical protein